MRDALPDSANRLLRAAKIIGIARAEPDEDGNPVGRVCIAVARKGFVACALEFDYGDLGRDAVADALRALTGTVTAMCAAA